MLRAINEERNSYFARDLGKGDRGEWICPNCNCKAMLVLPYEKINHFRHYSNKGCNPEPETEEHLYMKCLLLYSNGFKTIN